MYFLLIIFIGALILFIRNIPPKLPMEHEIGDTKPNAKNLQAFRKFCGYCGADEYRYKNEFLYQHGTLKIWYYVSDKSFFIVRTASIRGDSNHILVAKNISNNFDFNSFMPIVSNELFAEEKAMRLT